MFADIETSLSVQNCNFAGGGLIEQSVHNIWRSDRDVWCVQGGNNWWCLHGCVGIASEERGQGNVEFLAFEGFKASASMA